MRQVFIALLAGALLLCALPAAATGVIAGKVLDGEGDPIAGADVIADDGSAVHSDVTGPDGGFILPTVEAGTWTVTVSAAGHAAGVEDGLELQDDGNELIYTYDSQRERTGITTLLGELENEGIAFHDLNTSQSSLEEIFVDLVKRER